MKCLHCGTELSDQDAFCKECGTKVSKDVCKCGALKPSADALYCTNCGKLFISFSDKEIKALESYLRESRKSYKQLEEKLAKTEKKYKKLQKEFRDLQKTSERLEEDCHQLKERNASLLKKFGQQGLLGTIGKGLDKLIEGAFSAYEDIKKKE